MFSNLNTSSLEGFRDNLTEELAIILKKLKDNDERVIQSSYYNFLSTIKGRIFNDESLIDIIQECKEFKAPNSEIFSQEFQEYIQALCNIQNKYPDILLQDQDVNPPKIKTAKPSISSIGVFSDRKAPEQEHTPTISLLKKQAISTSDVKLSKKEMIQVLMTESKSENYNGFFLDMDDIYNSIDLNKHRHLKGIEQTASIQEEFKKRICFAIDQIIEAHEKKGIKRLQIIGKSGVHYIPMDIDIQNKSICIYDAAHDYRRLPIHSMTQFSKKIIKVIDVYTSPFEFKGKSISSGSLQKSEFGCDIFAIYLSREFSKLTHEDLISKSQYEKKTSLYQLDWNRLPPEIVCMAQSTTIIARYIDLNPNHKKRMIYLTQNNLQFHGYENALNMLRTEIVEICRKKSEKELSLLLENQNVTPKAGNLGAQQ